MSSAVQKRANAFASLDEAKLGWFHMRAVLVSGVGFFADAYDIFVIGLVLPMIYRYYPHMDALVKAATSWGNLVGQLGFGYLGDKLGRKKMYGVELIIMIVCTIGQCFSANAIRGFGVLTILGIWRFFLGVGIGGDYPMSAVITSEFANVRYRGMMLSAVFAMQGVGILCGGLVTLAALAAFQDQISRDYTYLDYVWRIALGCGVLPAIGAIYFRLTIPETPRYTVDVIGDAEKAESDVEKVLAMNNVRNITSNWKAPEENSAPERRVHVKKNDAGNFSDYFGQWKNFKILLGTAYCWFALDIAWYGLSLNQSVVLGLINYGGKGDPNQYEVFRHKAIGNVIIACLGTVPGYWVTVATIERIGRKPIQIVGFAVITVCLAVLAARWDTISLQETNFLIVFTIAQFFFNFGPNTTTFVYPGEVFPTRWRSTGHGISAAAGKVGAILGVQAVGPYFTTNAKIVLWTFAVIMATGVPATYFLLPETKGKTLEELSGEDEVIIEEDTYKV
ncbi:major facilitator superfamily domain-containing protein [Blyttiomyces helicus]|uniref:Major facilitator superfamily domain-containing protein n=1 Tax=Blyttiomyces helicus TaxID=388810 RepID=A0A4P9WKB0_9FUNG|nr:major facilitator superfamily domain-containing protein [Blyttiomyces helicus]|eukprot:RKO92433.1 major facilitator superfamily domain-containing protein [Blyttiomyces helicus]